MKGQILVHYTITPKRRESVFKDSFVQLVIEGHIRRTAGNLGCTIRAMAFQADHVHVMVELKPDVSVSFFAQQIKRVSSWRLRQVRPHLVTASAFWARRYYARSIGGDAAQVSKYINDQMRRINDVNKTHQHPISEL